MFVANVCKLMNYDVIDKSGIVTHQSRIEHQRVVRLAASPATLVAPVSDFIWIKPHFFGPLGNPLGYKFLGSSFVETFDRSFKSIDIGKMEMKFIPLERYMVTGGWLQLQRIGLSKIPDRRSIVDFSRIGTRICFLLQNLFLHPALFFLKKAQRFRCQNMQWRSQSHFAIRRDFERYVFQSPLTDKNSIQGGAIFAGMSEKCFSRQFFSPLRSVRSSLSGCAQAIRGFLPQSALPGSAWCCSLLPGPIHLQI